MNIPAAILIFLVGVVGGCAIFKYTAPKPQPLNMIPWTLKMDGSGCIYLPDYDDGLHVFKNTRLCGSVSDSAPKIKDE